MLVEVCCIKFTSRLAQRINITVYNLHENVSLDKLRGTSTLQLYVQLPTGIGSLSVLFCCWVLMSPIISRPKYVPDVILLKQLSL